MDSNPAMPKKLGYLWPAPMDVMNLLQSFAIATHFTQQNIRNNDTQEIINP